MKDATMAVEGFGNAGQFASQFVDDQGARLIAASDSKGGIYNKNGINVAELRRHKDKTGSVVGFSGTNSVSNEELLETECTILIPAALENQITTKNASRIKAKIVAEAANGPTTPDADEVLYNNKILVIPDILANGGGVTVSYFEWLQNLRRDYWTEEKVNERLDRNITKAFNDVYQTSERYGIDMRKASTVLAVNRVVEAIKIRGLWP
jgi:glutamate dehydrogenase/leucine dehydrogenase